MMQYKCDCCGAVAEIHQLGPEPAGCIEPTEPRGGWRAIYTVIEEYDDEGAITPTPGPVLYSCPDCNAQMTVDEHHEAELYNRNKAMWQPGPGNESDRPLCKEGSAA